MPIHVKGGQNVPKTRPMEQLSQAIYNEVEADECIPSHMATSTRTSSDSASYLYSSDSEQVKVVTE